MKTFILKNILLNHNNFFGEYATLPEFFFFVSCIIVLTFLSKDSIFLCNFKRKEIGENIIVDYIFSF